MKSSLKFGLAALALTTTPLAARATGFGGPPPAPLQTFSFEVLSVKPGSQIIDGGYASPYNATFLPSANTDLTSFAVWCVDLNHEAILGQVYNVTVTALTSLDFSNTRNPGLANLYRWEAELALDMHPDTWTAATGNTSVEDAVIQDAMWTLMGEENGDVLNSQAYDDKLNTFATTMGLGQNFWTTGPTDDGWKGFELLTCTPVATCGQQEFLAGIPGSPQETVTPEPGTISMLATGLVGMMGAGTLRRRRKTA